MKTLRWLHLTDLHLGMNNQDYLMPRFKKNLLEDFKKSHELSGPWDVVFFTGDLVQKGSSDEYAKVTSFLEELWDVFKKLGSNPILLPVPGNHDLNRPDSKSSVIKALKGWENDIEIRQEFWANPNCDYRVTIDKSFENYSNWFNKQNLKNNPSFVQGIMPGDYSCILEFREFKLGVIALNTTYLQLDGSDFYKKLHLDSRQFFAVCESITKWEDEVDLSILLTHHDPSWLNDDSKIHLNSEIAPPNMFHAHFCGHLHEPMTKIEKIMGSGEKSLRIGASMFGLEYYQNNSERIHGYSSGYIELDSKYSKEVIWPRKMAKKYSGSLQLGPDIGYELLDDNSIVYEFEYSNEEENEEDDVIKEDLNLQLISQGDIFNIDSTYKEKNILKLNSIPKYKLRVLSHYESIRKVEQARFEHIIRKNRFIWVFSDWGMGFDGFLSSVLSKMEFGNSKTNLFNLMCEDASSFNDILSLFEKQFNCGLEEFCQILNSDKQDSVLVINQISKSIVDNNEFGKLNEVVDLILDYCPNLLVILTIRQKIEGITEYVELKVLDMPQVRTYIKNHPEADIELDSLTSVESLYRLSGGLPMHLDRIIDSLKFTSIQELFKNDYDIDEIGLTLLEPIPKALQESVSYISSKDDKMSKRSFTLLKLLSVLENGQTLSSIKRYDHTKPFYVDNAVQLSKLSLLDSISSTDVEPSLKSHQENLEVQKVLKVPKQVRDYVKTLIPETEFKDILFKSASCLFGSKWREGKIKQESYSPLSKANKARLGIGNDLILTKLLLIQGLKDGVELDVKRAFNIAYSYCLNLHDNSNYHDSIIGCEELYHLIKETEFTEQLLLISILYGRSLRMDSNSNSALCIDILEGILTNNQFKPTRSQLTEIHISLALAYDNKEEKNKAVYHAEELLKLNPQKSWKLQAETVIVRNKYRNEKERLKELRKIEKKARRNKYFTVANNIAYDIARFYSKDDKDAIRGFNKIIKTKSDTLNIVHSIIRKAKIYLDKNEFSKIKSEDRLQLNLCYSYLYYQRKSYIFNQCHAVIWDLNIKSNSYSLLLKLFRHSSFVWRLTDREDLEKEYIENLKDIDIINKLELIDSQDKFNLDYFERRSAEYIHE